MKRIIFLAYLIVFSSIIFGTDLIVFQVWAETSFLYLLSSDGDVPIGILVCSNPFSRLSSVNIFNLLSHTDALHFHIGNRGRDNRQRFFVTINSIVCSFSKVNLTLISQIRVRGSMDFDGSPGIHS